ncbi:MAG: hypothetical protein JWM10_1377 [Myxococcaceae bacterium]|nr:hypothetical protein [Myxococcaceae bacterium]
MKVSRRQLLALGLGAVATRRAAAQTPPVLASSGAIPPNPFGDGPALPVVVAAPTPPAPAPAAPAPPSPEASAVPPNPYDANVRRYGVLAEEDIVRALTENPILSAREVGNTSINLRCDLEGPIDGAFKPAETRHVDHWRAEIGAFRVAQLLGLDRVPPAVFRRVSRDELTSIGADASRLLFRENWARGAMIYWVPVLRRAGIFSGEALTEWTNQLVVGVDIPAASRQRAEEISTLISYDFIIGNWDRWHGTNTLVDGRGSLVYRDNNGGFLEPMPRWKLEIIFSFLQRVQRFSRRFVDQVRAMSLAALRAAIAADADGREALLNEAQLRAMMRRRQTFLEYVDALAGIHGADEVFCFA